MPKSAYFDRLRLTEYERLWYVGLYKGILGGEKSCTFLKNISRSI